MTETIEVVCGRLKEAAGGWASYSAIGSLALYAGGYLSLRFHLTALGVGTDIAVLDERYFFTGAKFLVYLFATIPNVVLLALIALSLFAVFIYLPYRWWRRLYPRRDGGCWHRLRDWFRTPSKLLLSGIVISVLLIQLVMRQCFLFNNLLLAKSLPDPAWMQQLLLDEDNLARSLYFSSLVAGVAFAAWLLLTARGLGEQTARSRALTALLTTMIALQLLMLPINYGVLIMDKMLPKVTNLGGLEQLTNGQEAWLVWEGKDGVTYLVRSIEQDGLKTKLVTLPQKEVKKTEIIKYDPILRCLFVGGCNE